MSFREAWEKYYPKAKVFRSRVLLLAVEAGFRGPADADAGRPPLLTVRVSWKTPRPRVDWHDVFAAIKTSIWYGDSSQVQPGERSGFSCGNPKEYAEVEIRYGGYHGG